MNQRERNDAILLAALTPAPSTTLTSGLADAIHDTIAVTPQAKAPSRWSPGGLRFLKVGGVPVGLLLMLALLTFALVVAALVASRLTQAPRGVAMYRGGPERTGVMPGPGPVGLPTIEWQVPMKDGIAVMPVVVDGTVYVADESGVIQALDEADGKVRWTIELHSSVHGSPAFAGDRVFVGTDAAEVIAIEAATGHIAWRFGAAGPVRASIVIVRDLLYAGSDDGNVYALDVATGKERWRTPMEAQVTRGAAVSERVVYVGATGGVFAALDASTGKVRWSRRDLGPGEVGTPMVSGGLVFVATGLLEVGPADRISALDIRDGTDRWTFPTPDELPVYNGVVADGAVYISSDNGDVYRVNEMTGRGGASFSFHSGGGTGFLSGIVDGTLYVPSADRFIYAVDAATGTERWRFKVQGIPYGPAVVDGRIFVGTDLGKFYAIGGTPP